jgi:hypothetical protein
MNSDQPSHSQDRPIDVERAQATLRTMSDSELAALHAQTPDTLKPGAWEVVDQEIRRRARVKLRQGMTPPLSEVHPNEERYPAIRINVVLLKGLAVVVLVASVLGALIELNARAIVLALVFLVVGSVGAVSYWAGAELLVVLLDIEANTRALRDKIK